MDTGNKLRVSGEGNAGEGGGPPGDLYIFLTVKKHKYFERDEEDIHLTIEVPFTEAILGTTLEVPTLEGKAEIKIPAGTQPGTTLRLKNKGVSRLQSFGRGDQHVHIKVTLPTKLSGKEKDLLEEFNKLNNKKKSVFDRVRGAF